MARLLVVEDEPGLLAALRRGLADEQHAVDAAADGVTALQLAEEFDYDLLLLDVMLPHASGLDVVRRLRAQKRTVPVLLLTARDAKADIVAGLDAGADDYLTKPFAFEELIARIRSLLRRGAGMATLRLEVGPLVLDPASRRVWRDGVEVVLTLKEFQLLEALVRRTGTVLSRGRLADALWDRDFEPESNALEVYVASLRRKVEAEAGPRLIHTVRGIGYVVRWEP